MKTPIQNIIQHLEEVRENLIFDHSRELFKSIIEIVKAHQESEIFHLQKAFEEGEKDFHKCKYDSAYDYVIENYENIQDNN